MIETNKLTERIQELREDLADMNDDTSVFKGSSEVRDMARELKNLLTQEICRALGYFGPLNCEQLKEKLAARGVEMLASEIETVMEDWIAGQPAYTENYYRATGFTVKTYKY